VHVDNDHVAAHLIEQIRETSGLSRAELARRAGIQRSVLSSYEHGRRQPSVAALARIAAAGGQQLAIGPPSDAAALERASSVLHDVLGLADRMPSRDRGELRYPPLIRLAR
jgi:transcriptional regulator with XRE-family HTH domain